MTDIPITLRHADTPQELRACYAAMKQLRPHLQDESEFMERVTRQAAEGYRLLAAWQDGAAIALAGYRLQENLISGKFLYVDDLVTIEQARGRKCGERLLAALSDIAGHMGCVRLVLDTALSNALAQRFYFRQGLLTGAIRFSKPVTPRAA